jgi:hypothetical protein
MHLTKLAVVVLLAAFSQGAHALGGLADLTVYDRSDGRALPVYWHQGRAWVVGKPGNEYQLTVRSRQGEELLAVMSVDGVNVVTGETATAQQSGYVLAPGRPVEVKGWRKNLDRTAAFYFTSLPDSYAARTGRPDNVGSIGVALFRKKQPEPPVEIAPQSRQAPQPSESHSRDQSPPASAGAGSSARSELSSKSAQREDRLGTGHGRSEVSPVRYTSFERASSQPAETVVVFYDSHQNLVARGVIPGRPPAPRYPNPFPGFVADPA